MRHSQHVRSARAQNCVDVIGERVGERMWKDKSGLVAESGSRRECLDLGVKRVWKNCCWSPSSLGLSSYRRELQLLVPLAEYENSLIALDVNYHHE